MPLGINTAQNATATVAAWLLLTQASKERNTLAAHPVIQQLIRESELARTIQGINASALRTTTVDLGSLVGTATAEGALPAPSTFAVANVDTTPSRFSTLLVASDEEVTKWPVISLIERVSAMPEGLTEQNASVVAMVASAMTNAWMNSLVVLLKSTVSSLGNTSGVAATPYTYTLFRAAVKTARLIANGRGLTLINGANGWDSMEAEILTLGGAVQMGALGQRVVAEVENGNLYTDVYQSVDVLRTSGMPTIVADNYGGTYFPGCLALRTPKTMPPEGTSRKIVLQTPLWTLYELAYSGGSTTSYELVFYMALPIVQANLGFRILHD